VDEINQSRQSLD